MRDPNEYDLGQACRWWLSSPFRQHVGTASQQARHFFLAQPQASPIRETMRSDEAAAVGVLSSRWPAVLAEGWRGGVITESCKAFAAKVYAERPTPARPSQRPVVTVFLHRNNVTVTRQNTVTQSEQAPARGTLSWLPSCSGCQIVDVAKDRFPLPCETYASGVLPPNSSGLAVPCHLTARSALPPLRTVILWRTCTSCVRYLCRDPSSGFVASVSTFTPASRASCLALCPRQRMYSDGVMRAPGSSWRRSSAWFMGARISREHPLV